MREFPRKTTRAQILCSAGQGVSDLAGVSLLPEDVLSACHYRGRRERGEGGSQLSRQQLRKMHFNLQLHSWRSVLNLVAILATDRQRILHRDMD